MAGQAPRQPLTFEHLFDVLRRSGFLHVHIVCTGSDRVQGVQTPRFNYKIVTEVIATTICDRMPGRCRIIKLHDVALTTAEDVAVLA